MSRSESRVLHAATRVLAIACHDEGVLWCVSENDVAMSLAYTSSDFAPSGQYHLCSPHSKWVTPGFSYGCSNPDKASRV